MLTPTLAKVREGSLVVLHVPEAQEPLSYSFSSPVGDSGGPLIIHKRSRFIQVCFPSPICGEMPSGQRGP